LYCQICKKLFRERNPEQPLKLHLRNIILNLIIIGNTVKYVCEHAEEKDSKYNVNAQDDCKPNQGCLEKGLLAPVHIAAECPYEGQN
jgi:hypothetical protein